MTFPVMLYHADSLFFIYSSKILQFKFLLHPTILSNHYTNYRNITGTGPQGAKDSDYPVAFGWKAQFDQKSKDETSDDNHYKSIHHSSERHIQLKYQTQTNPVRQIPVAIKIMQILTSK